MAVNVVLYHVFVCGIESLLYQREVFSAKPALYFQQVSINPGLVLKVVNRLNGVDAPNSGVSKAEQEFLVIFISVSEILAYQQEVRLDRAGRLRRLC